MLTVLTQTMKPRPIALAQPALFSRSRVRRASFPCPRRILGFRVGVCTYLRQTKFWAGCHLGARRQRDVHRNRPDRADRRALLLPRLRARINISSISDGALGTVDLPQMPVDPRSGSKFEPPDQGRDSAIPSAPAFGLLCALVGLV